MVNLTTLINRFLLKKKCITAVQSSQREIVAKAAGLFRHRITTSVEKRGQVKVVRMGT